MAAKKKATVRRLKVKVTTDEAWKRPPDTTDTFGLYEGRQAPYYSQFGAPSGPMTLQTKRQREEAATYQRGYDDGGKRAAELWEGRLESTRQKYSVELLDFARAVTKLVLK